MTRVHQVWSTDITSSRLLAGVVYVVAVMDWLRRSVLSWAVSIALDVRLCLEALEHVLRVATPDIFHSDQGAQLTRGNLTRRFERAGSRVSLDGRGRALDHIVVERLWHTGNYEEVYVQDKGTPREAMPG